jgi:hypothetical protein
MARGTVGVREGFAACTPTLLSSEYRDDIQIATIAQSVEQTFRKRQVKSSNLFGGSK